MANEYSPNVQSEEETKSLGTKPEFDWQAIITWLYLPRAHLDLMRRLTGILSISVEILLWHWVDNARHTIRLSPLLIGNESIALPLPPTWSDKFVLSIHIICCLALFFGARKKIFLLVPLIIISYYSTLDLSCGSHFVPLTICLLGALCYDEPRSNSSLSRRLIQVAWISCYAFAVLQKVTFPDFLLGYSLENIFTEGQILNSLWLGWFNAHRFDHSIWQIFSVSVILFELWLAIGLCLKQTRFLAVVSALFFHFAIALFLDPLFIPFSFAMCIGLIAFIPKPANIKNWCEEEKEIKEKTSPINNVRILAALLFICLLVYIPGRFFLFPERSVAALLGPERLPWSFAMFTLYQSPVKSVVLYQDTTNSWHVFPINKRISGAAGNNELFSIAQEVFRQHPDAQKTYLDFACLVNKRWICEKTITVYSPHLHKPPDIHIQQKRVGR